MAGRGPFKDVAVAIVELKRIEVPDDHEVLPDAWPRLKSLRQLGERLSLFPRFARTRGPLIPSSSGALSSSTPFSDRWCDDDGELEVGMARSRDAGVEAKGRPVVRSGRADCGFTWVSFLFSD
jgi:hypothetical protein